MSERGRPGIVTALGAVDIELVREATEGFVPQDVFDIHAHLTHPSHFPDETLPAYLEPGTGYGLDGYLRALARWLPGRAVEGLFFGLPCAGNDRAGENGWVASQLDSRPDLRRNLGLALVSPSDDPGEVRSLMGARGFVGLKPYRLYAPVRDTGAARVEEFAPRWMWELCDAMDGVLMLHIVRATAIADRDNLEAITRLCREHPRCRLVLAHVARSFNYRNARAALRALEPIDNVVVDTSAVTEAEALRVALDVLGPRRVLFGSDYMVSELRGKCFTMGDGFAWVYADALTAGGMSRHGEFTLVGIESLLCLREACSIVGLAGDDIGQIFRGNALRLLAPHLPPDGTAATAPRGPELWAVARGKITCGTGLLSKRAEGFDPVTWPSYFSRCAGANVWDLDGRRLVDFTGGVGAILLGHADAEVNAAVRRRVSLGSYCTLVAPEEIDLADLLLELHPWAARVRYARGGGEALALAVRIARAASGRSGIAFCGYHGWSDWYLAANLGDAGALEGHLLPGLEPLGVPGELAGTAVPFRYNDLDAFGRALSALGNNLAAVVMEPMRSELPRDRFVERVAAACRAAGAVFVVDEVTAGWRYGFPGGCVRLGIEPDIAVYAKAMSNGIPSAAVVGREEVMEGAAARSFVSSSYWTDGIGPAAALACIRKMRRERTQEHVWTLGETLGAGLRRVAAEHPSLRMTIGGQPPSPSIGFALGEDGPAARALMIRGMLARGFLFSGQLYLLGAHGSDHVTTMLDAFAGVAVDLAGLQARGLLRAEAGARLPSAGFRRLA